MNRFLCYQGELEHKRPKGFYARTDKRNFTVQIAKHERRQRTLRGIAARPGALVPITGAAKKRRKITYNDRGAKATLKVSFHESEPLPASALKDAYHISVDQRFHVDLTRLLTSNHEDPAYKVTLLISGFPRAS